MRSAPAQHTTDTGMGVVSLDLWFSLAALTEGLRWHPAPTLGHDVRGKHNTDGIVNTGNGRGPLPPRQSGGARLIGTRATVIEIEIENGTGIEIGTGIRKFPKSTYIYAHLIPCVCILYRYM